MNQNINMFSIVIMYNVKHASYKRRSEFKSCFITSKSNLRTFILASVLLRRLCSPLVTGLQAVAIYSQSFFLKFKLGSKHKIL